MFQKKKNLKKKVPKLGYSDEISSDVMSVTFRDSIGFFGAVELGH